MKLPAIKYKTGVESLATISPSVVTRVGMQEVRAAGAEALAVGRDKSAAIGAKAASEFAMFGAALTGTDVAMNMATSYLNRQTEIEVASSNQAMAKEMTEWLAGPGNQPFFTAEEVEGIEGVRTHDIIIGKNGMPVETPRNRIPAYEVRAELYKRQVDESIKAHAEKITVNARAKDMWIADRQLKAEENYGKFKGQAIIQQHEYNRETQHQNITEYLQTGKYALALKTAYTYDGTEAEIQAQVFRVRVGTETYSYDDAMSRESLDDINKSIGILENPEYYDTGGMLNDKTRHTYLNQLRNARDRIMKAGLAGLDVSHNELMDKINRTTEEMRSGSMRYNVAWTNNLIREYKENGLGIGVTAKAANQRIKMGNFLRAIEETRYDNSFNLAPISIQELELGALRSVKDRSPYDSARYRRTSTLFNKNSALMDKNPVDYGIEKQFIKPIGPVKWSDREDTAVKLGQMERDARMVANRFGPFKGYMSAATADELSVQIEKSTTAEKLEIIKNINLALPETANVIYDQLTEVGVKDSFSLAGQLAYEGFMRASGSVLLGQDILQERPTFLTENNAYTPLMGDIREKLGNVYYGNADKYEQISTGIVNAYVHLSNGKTEYDDKTFQAAMDMILPNVVKYQGSDIATPSRSMHGNTFIDWIDTLDSSYIHRMGGVKSLTNQEVLDKIHDGDFKLLNGPAPEVYMLYNEESREGVFQPSGEPFYLIYDENAPRFAEVKAKERAQAVIQEKQQQKQQVVVKEESEELYF